MAIRIQCSECKRRIVIDDAFAGGACRCPFCSEIVMVPGGEGEGTSDRPDSPRPESPDSPERPAEPGGRPAEPGAEPKAKPPIDPKSVPVARADRTMTYVMFGAVAALAAAVIVAVVLAVGSGVSDSKDTKGTTARGGNAASNGAAVPEYYDMPVGTDPFKTVGTGPVVAGDVSLLLPVVYVLDGGQVMHEVFDNAVAIANVSIGSLGAANRFSVIISAHTEIETTAGTPPAPLEAAATPRVRATTRPADEPEPAADEPAEKHKREVGKDLYMPGGWLPGNTQSQEAFQEWVRRYQERDEAPRGQTDVLASVDTALSLRPKTVVMFTLKDLVGPDGQLLPEAAAVAARAKSMGISVVAIGLHKGSGVNAQVKAGLEQFAAACGSEARNYGFDRLAEWATEYRSVHDTTGTGAPATSTESCTQPPAGEPDEEQAFETETEEEEEEENNAWSTEPEEEEQASEEDDVD
ncbi:MAG: hypothetical protein FWE88_00650 [Phycisphaerae bacterium]|nr:hypothetical protein [Phycisphaerae bacterium]